MSDTQTARTGVSPLLRKANAVIGVADLRGWPRPQPYIDSLEMLNAARTCERDVPAFPAPPTNRAASRNGLTPSRISGNASSPAPRPLTNSCCATSGRSQTRAWQSSATRGASHHRIR